VRRVFAIVVAGAVALGACGGVQRRFPDEVQASLADSELRRLETDRFIIYYPANRRAEVDRFVVRAERCVEVLRASAMVHTGPWLDKMVIAMPDVALNNAFVIPDYLGYEHVSIIPLTATLDFSTEFGLVPDPGYIACHELTHYVQLEQVRGFWRYADAIFGHLYTPQLGYDPWFLEGLATHYEARLSPGVGRPTWPIFTGMFAAAYAGVQLDGGDMSEHGRLAPVGHHYLVGSMFVRFLAEVYGEKPLWVTIRDQARALTGWLFAGTFKAGYGKSFAKLIDEFNTWSATTFPVRQRPAEQRTLARLGNDARYARGRDGTEAWVADDVDAPPRLTVRDAGGAVLAEINLVGLVPPRTLVQASPLLVSGLSVTANGGEVWLTVIDADTTYQVPRLLRWRRGESSLTEISHELGPGATIDPSGAIYYYCAVDGDRWSLAAWDVQRGQRKTLLDMAPGTYALGAQVSPDGARLVANVWDGTAFVAWVIDAATGARQSVIRGDGTPVWDASFADDGRVMYLGVIDRRFQLMVDGEPVTDAPYAVLAAREAHGTIRFLNRDGWDWTLDEVAGPRPKAPPPEPEVAAVEPPAAELPAAESPSAAAPSAVPSVLSDQPYSPFEHLLFPQLRSPTILSYSSGTPHVGVVLGGGDRLDMQRWSIAGYVQPASDISDQLHWGADAAYLNMMLAPWQIYAAAGFVDWVDPVATDDPDVTLTEERRTRDAQLTLSRLWRGTLQTQLSGIYTEDTYRLPGQRPSDPLGPPVRRELGGAGLSLAWVWGDATAYTGRRRVLTGNAAAAYYPRSLSSFAGDIYDTGGALGTVLPLPFGRRHTLSARLRGRALVSSDNVGLLQLGGESGVGSLFSASSVATEPPSFDSDRFPPNLRFIEVLRGYEDYAITTDRAAIGDLSWRYPLIIDRGFAATFGFLPASYVSQIDFELFAAGAFDQRQDLHAAAGALIDVRLTVLRLPFVVAYQIARRLRDDEAITQIVSLGLGL
jgi:hypothetical protein